MEERTYLHLVEAVAEADAARLEAVTSVTSVKGNKYIFFGPDGLKEAMTKALVLNAKVTRIRVFPDGSIKEMVIYSGSAASEA